MFLQKSQASWEVFEEFLLDRDPSLLSLRGEGEECEVLL